jgi:hypothetical protein
MPRGDSTFGFLLDRPIPSLVSTPSGASTTTAHSDNGAMHVTSRVAHHPEWTVTATSAAVPHLRTLRIDVAASDSWPARVVEVTVVSDAAVGPALNLDLELHLRTFRIGGAG